MWGTHFFCEIMAGARIFRGFRIFCYTDPGISQCDQTIIVTAIEIPFLEIFSQAKDKFGQIDIVVGNAGILDEFNWELCLNINLVSKLNHLIMMLQNPFRKTMFLPIDDSQKNPKVYLSQVKYFFS